MMTEKELTDVCHVVAQKVFNYTEKYGKPNFIKIPAHMYRELFVLSDRGLVFESTPTLLFGMGICPTLSIQTADEIEVF